MAAFSGSARPTVAGGPDFCGTYTYEAGRRQASGGGSLHYSICP
jgi:hypothetical protein